MGWVIPSEIFPLKHRGSAMSVSVVVNWATNLVVSITYLSLAEFLGTVCAHTSASAFRCGGGAACTDCRTRA